MRKRMGLFFSHSAQTVRPVSRLSSVFRFALLDAPHGAGHNYETGCHYGVAYLLNCGNASGAFQPLFYFVLLSAQERRTHGKLD